MDGFNHIFELISDNSKKFIKREFMSLIEPERGLILKNSIQHLTNGSSYS
jgi:hypothetical protein